MGGWIEWVERYTVGWMDMDGCRWTNTRFGWRDGHKNERMERDGHKNETMETMDGWIQWMDGWTDEWVDVLSGWKDSCLGGWMDLDGCV